MRRTTRLIAILRGNGQYVGKMTRILFDSRWIAPHGIGRVAAEYRARLSADFTVIDYEDTAKPSSPKDFIALARAFRRSGADLLFTPGYNGTPLVGRGQLFIVHDLIHFGEQEPGGFKKRLYYNTITRAAARRGLMLTVSEASADEIVARWPEQRGRIRVVPNGLSPVFHAREAPVARRGLTLFANARWQKNLPAMLAAIAAWQARGGSDEPVTLIGPPQPASELAAAAGVRHLVFAGRIDDAGLAALLRRSRALLFCSLLEGFGLPLLEALACGCPVVASDIPVFREVGTDGCALVDPADIASIAAGIDRAIAITIPPELSRAVAERHDWSNSYRLVAAAIRDTLASAGP